eukprot:4094717-Amphidinium_carterae.1
MDSARRPLFCDECSSLFAAFSFSALCRGAGLQSSSEKLATCAVTLKNSVVVVVVNSSGIRDKTVPCTNMSGTNPTSIHDQNSAKL